MREKLNYSAKKSLGQHFLTARGTVNDIIKTAEIREGKITVEIGPGKGALTSALLSAGAVVIAVEKDKRMVDLLKEKFARELKSGQLVLANEDILNFDFKRHDIKTGGYNLVANIPYYITGEILRLFIGGEIKPSRAVLLVQKEVAERIAARDGKESILSVSIKLYGLPKYIKKVPARYFSPPPKVDSAILLIENIKESFANKREQERFFEIMKTGFGHKRKMLMGNLKTIFAEESLRKAFGGCGLNEKTRAENITTADWKCLSRELNINA
ncbi:MAG: 16S rRNA (adenine(1518)-N(6)/adenine(1519)-N(6))-dimethyltransferase RsmA [Candidatus Paceibacterota bacterium]|jgi:16S rRNA (adenine1518-N6/adenine1519-N6)-dimethyltransferase